MKTVTRHVLFGLLGFGLVVGVRAAQAANTAGTLDTSFGTKGTTVTTLTNASENSGIVPYSVKLQSDGKILVLVDVSGTNSSGAFTTTDVLRYTSTGVLDTSFGDKGIAVLPTTVSAMASMAVQSNGQIAVAGLSGFDGPAIEVQRLNTNGTVDTTFGTSGLAVANAGRGTGPELVVLIESNDDILVAGQLEPIGRGQPFQTVLARFTSGGALDTTFGSQGISIATAVGGCTALAELSTGEILVVNGEAIAQFTSTGSLESTVTGGTIVASAGSQNPSTPSIFEPNGDYLFATQLFVGEESRGHNSSVQVFRFTSTGTADSTFPDPSFHFAGSGGSGIEAVPDEIAVQSNGDIVVVGAQITFVQSGTTTVNGLARLTASGALDATFGTGGTVTNSVPAGTEGLEGVVIQPADGKIVTIGIANSDTALTISRYLGQ
jgi:uncharacterized delta-60 repeat protein